ncbi:MAG: hypothetical protein IJN75_05055 [Clostridia bacterium]|nr:hypothetical protein [Clostridia bacterium]
MKKVLILDGGDVGTESSAIRSALECFGYIVTVFYIGRPQDYFDALGGKLNFDFDYLVICCHGEDGKIIAPVLADEVYLPDECRGALGFDELCGAVAFNNKITVCTGCTTGYGELYRAFTEGGNSFVAPRDYIDGKSCFLFVVTMFYHLSNDVCLKESCELSRAIDSETELFGVYGVDREN